MVPLRGRGELIVQKDDLPGFGPEVGDVGVLLVPWILT